MGNIYDTLFTSPALEQEEMLVETEQMAMQLLRSGRLRIEAEDRGNFIRVHIVGINEKIMLSRRELFDKRLLPITEQRLASIVKKRFPAEQGLVKARMEIKRLQQEIKRYNTVDQQTALSIARLIVQSAEPVVVALLLLEDAEIFVSYGHNIREMVHTPHWQYHGLTSGMQSSDGYEVAVYTSCNGDPFLSQDDVRHEGDGKPALARMMVILAQEMGHFADIIRDAQGKQISRHASDLHVTKAKQDVRLGRLNDIRATFMLQEILTHAGIKKLLANERKVKFYQAHQGSLLLQQQAKQRLLLSKQLFLHQCRKAGLSFVDDFKHHTLMGGELMKCLMDTRFNLAPVADAYVGKNDQQTEAIACVEALARVPQQVIKWGHRTIKDMMPKLYHIYYQQVIPTCYQDYYQRTGKHFPTKFRKFRVPLWKKLYRTLDKIIPEK